MQLWVSKEAPEPQQCRNKRKMAVDYHFKAKNFELLNLKSFLCIQRNSLCIIEVTGAMWIIALGG